MVQHRLGDFETAHQGAATPSRGSGAGHAATSRRHRMRCRGLTWISTSRYRRSALAGWKTSASFERWCAPLTSLGPLDRKISNGALLSFSRTNDEHFATFLLPNSIAEHGMRRDVTARAAQKSPTKQHNMQRGVTLGNGRNRFRKPLLYPTELRDQNENFAVGFFGCSFPFAERRLV